MTNWLDLSNNANCFKSMYIDGFLDISGGNIQTRGPNDNLIVQGDVSLNGNVYLDKYLSLGVPKYTNTYNYTVTDANSKYVFNGGDYTDTNNPVLTFYKGSTYNLTINASGHPFYFQTTDNGGAYDVGNVYNDGITNNGTQTDVITFIVPDDAPSTLYYRCSIHSNMGNTINIQTFQKYGMDVSGVVDLSGDLYMKSGDISGTNLTVMGDCSVNGVFNGLAANISDATFNNDVIMQNRLFVNSSDLSYNGITGYNTTVSLATNAEWNLDYNKISLVIGDFGSAIAINSNATMMVVGAPQDNGDNKGAAKVYKNDGTGTGSWADITSTLMVGANNGNYYGICVAMSADGNIVAIGSRYVNNINTGRVNIYEYSGSGTTWNIKGEIDGSTSATYGNDGIGNFNSLSINAAGTRIVVGGNGRRPYVNGSSEGVVYVYDYSSGTTWNKVKTWYGSGTLKQLQQTAINATGDIIAFTANQKKTVSIYQNTSGTTWQSLGTIVNTIQTGHNITLNDSGHRIALGTFSETPTSRVYEYSGSGTTWNQMGTTFSESASSLSYPGVAFNSTGDIFATGYSNADVSYKGRVFVYKWNGASWDLIDDYLKGASNNAYLGGSVGLDSTGYKLAIGAPGAEYVELYSVGTTTTATTVYSGIADLDTGGNFSTTDISLNDPLIVPGNITIVDNSANNYGAYITYAQKSGADYFNMGKSVANVFNIVNQNNIGIYMPTGSNSFTGTSDERLKKDIEPLENGTDKVMQLKPCSYKWKTQTDEDTEKHVGFIAQEVEEVLPEVVNENEYPDGSKYKGVSTTDMIPYLIKMNNELENRLKKLEN